MSTLARKRLKLNESYAFLILSIVWWLFMIFLAIGKIIRHTPAEADIHLYINIFSTVIITVNVSQIIGKLKLREPRYSRR